MKECVTHHHACDCREAEFAKLRHALAYYKNGMLHQAPPYVPARVRLHSRVHGDGPWHSTFADAGEHDCESNQWGAISVRATNGSLLGVKPAEFEVVSWRPNDMVSGGGTPSA